MTSVCDNPMLDHALRYSVLGWPVFPMHSLVFSEDSSACSCGNQKCFLQGKHPRTMRGAKAATTEKNQILEWWNRWPNANIGVASGFNSTGRHLLVIDVDLKYYCAYENRSVNEFYSIPETPESITGSGGKHIFLYSDVPVKCSVDKLAAGIDVKCDNGYIIAPPGSHKSGNVYKWKIDPFTTSVATAPEHLLALLASERLDAETRHPDRFDPDFF